MKNSTASDNKGRWLRVAASAIAVAVLLAVPALGLAQFATGLFSPWAGADDQVSHNVFVLDGPAATMARAASNSGQNKGNAGDEILVLSGWNFTAVVKASPSK